MDVRDEEGVPFRHLGWAILICPFIPTLVFLIGMLPSTLGSGYGYIFAFLFGWLVTFSALLVFGFPVVAMLYSAGWLSLWSLAIFGAIGGLAVGFLIGFVSIESGVSTAALFPIVSGISVAVVLGLMLGVGFRRMPKIQDKD